MCFKPRRLFIPYFTKIALAKALLALGRRRPFLGVLLRPLVYQIVYVNGVTLDFMKF